MTSDVTEAAVALLAPDRIKTAFFQACLGDKDAASRGFSELMTLLNNDFVGYLAEPGHSMRGHLSLLLTNLETHGVEIPKTVRPYLRTAISREKLRQDIFETCMKDALTHLNSSGCEYVAVKGVAAAFSAYGEPHLRHCHDFDIVVSPEDQSRLADAFNAAGYTHVSQNNSSLRFDHPVGLPVMLHSEPARGLPYPDHAVMRRNPRILETRVGVLRAAARPAAVLHSCLHGNGLDRKGQCNWVPDAILTLRQFDGPETDEFVKMASLPDTAWELRPVLTYLKTHFEDALPLPDTIDTHLVSDTQRAERVKRIAIYLKTLEADERAAFFKAVDPELRSHLRWKHYFPPAEYFELPENANSRAVWQQRLKRLGTMVYWKVAIKMREMSGRPAVNNKT